MRRTETIRQLAAAAVVLLGSWSAPAWAEDADSTGDERREIVVLSFDKGTEAGALMETVADELSRARYEVLAGEDLAKRLGDYQHEEVPEDVAADFAGIADSIGDGVKSFFYKGNETAVEELTPIFDLGVGHPEMLVRRPDFAEQIFQAGIVLMRSHRNLNQDEKARAVARQLVRTLPGREPSPSTAPPGMIRFFRDQREKLEDQGTKLGIQKVDSDQCAAYLNGTQVGNSMYVVAPGEEYYVRLDCGTARTPVWRTTVPQGEHVTVPVASQSPQEFAMESGDFTARKTAENYLRLVQFWTDVPQVLGVKQKTPGTSRDGVLVVRVDSNGEATWSDTKDRGEIRRAISRVMPEYGETPSSSSEAPAGPGPSGSGGGDRRWVDWTLLGVGGAAVAGGVVGTVVTEQRAKKVRCSPDTGASPSDCGDVEEIRLPTTDQVRQAEREVGFARAGYVGAYVIGAGLATWGTLRLLDRGGERAGNPSAAPKAFSLTPRRGGATVQVELTW
jgi:hypothetical protein